MLKSCQSFASQHGAHRRPVMDMEHLILLVRERPEIYDPRHIKHRDRNFIRLLWADIARELGTNQTLAKTKWQTLRSNFMREKRKLKTLASGFGVQNARVTWPYMKLMSFLDKIVTHRDTPLCKNITYNPFYENNKDQLSYDRPIKEEPVSLGEPPLEVVTNQTTERTLQDDDICSEQLSDLPQATEDDIDPDLMFLQSLLPSIKQLTPLQNLEFKGEVINLLKQKLS